MNFDISKLDSLPGKAAGAKAKPKFGPAIRARPKPQAKPVEDTEAPSAAPSTDAQDTQALQSGSEQPPRADAPDAQPAAETNVLDGATETAREGQGAAAEQLPAPAQASRFRPAAGKRKAPEPPAVPEGRPELPQAPTAASPAADNSALAVVPTEDAVATQPDSGPMTKAKKRKGMAKGSGAQKSKTPLAQQKIDPVSMPLKTVIKVACAKDKVKSAAVKAAKARAAAQSGSQHSSPSTSLVQQEPPTGGVAQMVVHPDTGELVIDPESLTMQAQAPVQLVRREDNDDVLINSMSHMKREASTRWSPEETEEWYLALGIFGTNFQAVADRLNSRMAQQGLAHLRRSRKQVKLKFNKEEKLHPRRIDSTLRGQNAMPEDYIEIIHDIKAARNEVQEDETAYLEDAPGPSAADHQSEDAGTQQATQIQHPEQALSRQEGIQHQPHLQSHTTGSKGQGLLRARPRVKAGVRPADLANSDPAGAEQTAPNKAEGDLSFVRMLEEQNAVNAEVWREEDNAY